MPSPSSPSSPASPSPAPTATPLPAAPTIHDPAMAQRLRANRGLTLQWIDWDRRGAARIAVQPDGAWRLTGSQQARTGAGRLALDGTVTEVGADYFLFDGTIKITDAPDPGRQCSADKVWRFAITQNRPYWRLREFEWCDGLTDYVDIYF
ncbi:hypothetical protein GRI99_17265 [Altererythrobacter buctensis]|uniref:DUF1579 domain-containing protein n=2 Tax=Alteraurantiacibacter buctensis TaxID=1503981 RepID=A0A844Z2C1_9SPHN|nr:hypothetical protein [Alteraurantiacibacter buctensis]